MAFLDAQKPSFFESDAWAWWQARRLTYNLVLAGAGWGAYFAAVALNYAFGHRVWADLRGAIGMTLFLGSAWLVVIGMANVAFLLGPAVETAVRPADIARYRKAAWRMGLIGSAAVPFLFPLVQFAVLLANSR